MLVIYNVHRIFFVAMCKASCICWTLQLCKSDSNAFFYLHYLLFLRYRESKFQYSFIGWKLGSVGPQTVPLINPMKTVTRVANIYNWIALETKHCSRYVMLNATSLKF
jgi:hypothetical protein